MTGGKGAATLETTRTDWVAVVRELTAQYLVGELENELESARLAVGCMIDAAVHQQPGPETTNRVLIGRTLAGRAAMRTVEKAMEVVGGTTFFRSLGLERLYRDVQAVRFHQLQEKPQLRYAGRLALGLDVNG